jgi:hypothetical protein
MVCRRTKSRMNKCRPMENKTLVASGVPFQVRALTTVDRDRAPVCVNTWALVGLLHSTVSSRMGGTQTVVIRG